MKILEKVLLRPRDFKPSLKNWKIEGIFNPGAIRTADKKIVLYVRVSEQGHMENGKTMHCPVVIPGKEYELGSKKIEKAQIIKKEGNIIYLKSGECRLTTMSHFKRVILDRTGMKVLRIEKKPIFTGLPTEGNYGVEDPRLIRFGKRFLMTYVSVSSTEGVSTALATSKDLVHWKRKGIIFRTQNKDAIIFPEKIDGEYVAFHRPDSSFIFSKPSIWIAYSKDLIYWGRDKSVLRPREDSWDSVKVGTGPPPIKTKKGWLIIYHGIKEVKEKNHKRLVYSAGAVLLDLKHPTRILARSPKDAPLFEPNGEYEREGFTGNVVFPTGIVPTLDKKSVLIYSGEADRLISVRKIKIQDILESMEYYTGEGKLIKVNREKM